LGFDFRINKGENRMTDEPEMEPLEDEIEILDSGQAFDFMETTMETLLDAASVGAVYGDPIQNGDTLIIPAAEVLSVAGFGAGSGYGTGGPGGDGPSGSGSGGGGGGGGRVLARPVAVIISSPEGVRVEPIVDPTKIALAGLTAIGFMLAMASRMRNPRRALKALKE
jgi:uncharacterized spore protein YtfJ